jgi:hypothetical protein
MSPLAVVLNIAIIVGIVGIIVYWVRRFAVFRGYKSIEDDVLKVGELLKAQAVRDGADVVLAGYCGGLPTYVRFSHKVDTPGLDIRMSVPATFNFSLTPKSVSFVGEGKEAVRTGIAALDSKFNARADEPVDVRMWLGTKDALARLEQLCCSSQTGLSIKDKTLELSELTIPAYTANHVADHLESMAALAKRMQDMPGAMDIKIDPLPPQGSSWPVRVALAGGLVCLLALLFIQPYQLVVPPVDASRTSAHNSGVTPADAARIQQLQNWHVAGLDDFSGPANRFLHAERLKPSGHVTADFSGLGSATESAYLLVNAQGKRRVCLLARGTVAYDAVFDRAEFVARIPKTSLAKIQWSVAPQFKPDGDALLVVQDAENPSASLVLLRHGIQTYSARPMDYNRIELAPE